MLSIKYQRDTSAAYLTLMNICGVSSSLGIHSSFSSPEFKTKTPDTSASLSGSSTWLNTFNVQLLTWNLVFRIIWCLTNEGKYFSLSPPLRLSSFSCQNLCFYFPSSFCEISGALTSKHRIQPGGDRQVTCPSNIYFSASVPAKYFY